MRVLKEDGNVVVPVELADLIGLFLGEEHAAIGRAENTVGVVRSLPDKLPFRARCNNPWDFDDGHFPDSLLLSCAALRCGRKPAEDQRRSTETRYGHEHFQFHKLSNLLLIIMTGVFL